MAARSAVILRGKLRTLGGGQRSWRAALYRPSTRYASYRVIFKVEREDGEWEWQTRGAVSEDEARALFARAEKALDALQPTPATQRVQRGWTIRALGEQYLTDSRARGKQDRTLEQRESRLNAHILPTIGGLRASRSR
jgi:hypothetical protein